MAMDISLEGFQSVLEQRFVHCSLIQQYWSLLLCFMGLLLGDLRPIACTALL